MDMFEHLTTPSEFLEKLKRFREEEILCDVFLHIGNDTFKAHKIVLACFSPYFRELFETDDFGDDTTIHLKDVRSDTLRELLEVAYGGTINITTENVQELLLASNFFNLANLQRSCEIFAGHHVGIDNCGDVLDFCRQYGFGILQKKAIEAIPDDIDILQSLELSPNQLLEYFENGIIILKKNGLPLSKEDREIFLLTEILQFLSNNPEHITGLPECLQRIRIPIICGNRLTETMEGYPQLYENEIVSYLLRLATLVRSGRSVPEVPPLWKTECRQGFWKLDKTGLYSEKAFLGPPVACFDDSDRISPHVAMRKIILYFRLWDDILVLGGMKIKYDDGSVFSYGLDPSSVFIYEQHYIKLEAGEWINKINVNSGWLIDNIVLTTNQDRVFGPFGDMKPGGGRHDTCVEEGRYNHLHAFYGNVVLQQGAESIRQIGFTWAKYENEG